MLLSPPPLFFCEYVGWVSYFFIFLVYLMYILYFIFNFWYSIFWLSQYTYKAFLWVFWLGHWAFLFHFHFSFSSAQLFCLLIEFHSQVLDYLYHYIYWYITQAFILFNLFPSFNQAVSFLTSLDSLVMFMIFLLNSESGSSSKSSSLTNISTELVGFLREDEWLHLLYC